MPRARLRRATSSSEPSSVVRSTEWSSDIGFFRTTGAWRGSSSGIRSRSTRSGAAKLQPTASNRPAPTSASSARRRSFCSGSRRPLAPRRDGSVAGIFSSPQSRATSSTRSASRVTSPRRNAGTVTSSPSSASATPNSSRRSSSAASPRGTAVPSSRSVRASRSRITTGAGPGPPTSTVPGTSRAPARPAISIAASAWPSMPCSGCRPFSKRPLASVRRPSRVDVRCRFGPFQVAASISTRVVVSRTSERSPPIRPAIEVGPSSSQMISVSGSSSRSTSSSVVSFSPSRARLTTSRPPATRSKSNACIGWPVASITKLVMSTTLLIGRMPGRGQPRLQPRGRRADLHVLEQARGEARAQVRVLDRDRHAAHVARRARVVGPQRLGQRRAGRRVDLARDAVDAEAVRPVRRDLQLEHVGGDRQHVGQRRARARGRRTGP